MLIGFGSDRAVYLFAFAKNERENIDNAELRTLREIAARFLNASKEQIANELISGNLVEVDNGDENKKDGKSQSAREGATGNGE